MLGWHMVLSLVAMLLAFKGGLVWSGYKKEEKLGKERVRMVTAALVTLGFAVLLVSSFVLVASVESKAKSSTKGIALEENDLKTGVIYSRWHPGSHEYISLAEEPSSQEKIYRLPRAAIPDQCDRFTCIKDQDGTLNYLSCPKKEEKAEDEKVVVPIK